MAHPTPDAVKNFPLIIVAGPTGVGKSALALSLAEKLGAEILCCDSVQVYRGMDIGTAKVTAEERGRVRHHGLDLVEPDQCFDVEQFSRHAIEVVGATRGPLVVVGGSGFYLQVFCGPTTDGLTISPSTRSRVESIFQGRGLAGLLEELDRRSGCRETAIDRCNPRRVLRALERCVESGQSLEAIRAKFSKMSGPFDGLRKFTVLLEDSGTTYEEHLRTRLRSMLEGGLIGETECLRRKNFERNPSACCAVGYRQVLAYLDGKISSEELPEQIFARTKNLIRRQRSWFRHRLPFNVALAAGTGAAEKALKFFNF
ncbi:MAG: tRNA (adenosine(37)-N6)-dimethylallyltransferase MiaA [Puniceicoccales bacterium]|jgi:tRNA dimethylallyltransferase|nr:tRNA (adenosine(37)-N6)-dimethylallyltransferase MiaA [Puniceicoccales bacterium]